MKLQIYGKNLELTPRLQSQVENKLSKLERYLKDDTEVQATLSVEKDRHKIEVTIPMKGTTIRAEEISQDMYSSIDMVEETIERQLRRHKTRLINRYQSGFTPAWLEEEAGEEEDGIRIVRTKRFAVKPMDATEACLQMELLGHAFYMFLNSETNEVNVVYKRNDGAFGLIEPVLDDED